MSGIQLVALLSCLNAPAPELPNVGPPPKVYTLVHVVGRAVGPGQKNIWRNEPNFLQLPKVIDSVLARSEVASLRIIKAQKDPAAWLRANIRAEFTHEEVFRIGFNDGPPEQLAVLADAMAEAYIEHVIVDFRLWLQQGLFSNELAVRQYEIDMGRLRERYAAAPDQPNREAWMRHMKLVESSLHSCSECIALTLPRVRKGLPSATIVRPARRPPE